jgi:hypothetical protein
VIKILAIIVGLFLVGLAYLQYHQIANINWNKLQHISEDAITTLSNVIMQIPAIGNTTDHASAKPRQFGTRIGNLTAANIENDDDIKKMLDEN